MDHIEPLITQLRAIDPAINFSTLLGIDITAARIFLSLQLIFILTFPQKFIVQKLSIPLQHIINSGLGVLFMYYCFGFKIWHEFLDIMVVFVIIKLFKGTRISVVITWVFVFGHLLLGYYDIANSDTVGRLDWTVLHCILTLKLIGLVMDLNDYTNISRKLTPTTDKAKLPLDSDNISLLELIGFSFNMISSIVGPILRFKRYKNFVDGTLYQKATTPSSIVPGLQRYALAMLCSGLFALLSPYCSLEYVLTEEFASKPQYYKLAYSGFRLFVSYKQYYTIWLLSEASCIISGLSYNGKDKDGNVDWHGCAGIYLSTVEFVYSTQHMISGFNISTNDWVLHFVYKRFRFLKSRVISQFFAIMFLATWHGLLGGYYICFIMEIPIVQTEKAILDIINHYFRSHIPRPIKVVGYIFGYFYTLVAVGCPLACFQLLTTERALHYMKNMDYIFWIFYAIITPISMGLQTAICNGGSKAQEKKAN